MIKIFQVIIIVSFVSACGVKRQGITNTRWEHKIGDEIGFMEFSENDEYTNYDAELGERFYGTYKLKNDHVILYQKKSEYDNQFSETSRHRTQKDTFELIIKNDNQLGYKEFWDDKGWKDNFFYTKVK